jgi:hypothetical protein
MAKVTAIVATTVASSYMQNKAAKKAARAAAAARGDANAQFEIAQQRIDEAVKGLEAVGVPPIEAMKVVLESPELVGLENFRELSPSSFQDIETNPLYKEAQERALSGVQEVAEEKDLNKRNLKI